MGSMEIAPMRRILAMATDGLQIRHGTMNRTQEMPQSERKMSNEGAENEAARMINLDTYRGVRFVDILKNRPEYWRGTKCPPTNNKQRKWGKGIAHDIHEISFASKSENRYTPDGGSEQELGDIEN